MEGMDAAFGGTSRLAVLLQHFSRVEDRREPWRVAHPLPEVLLLVVCGSMADCDDFDAIAEWGTSIWNFSVRSCHSTTASRRAAG